MTVAAMVSLRPRFTPPADFPTGGYLPIAAERAFTDFWLPLARNAGLQWIPLFATGLPLTAEDIGSVIGELDVLAARLPDQTTHADAQVHDRSTLLRNLLASLDPDSVEDLFIG